MHIHLTAFFENYGTAFTILKNIFGEGNYNSQIPKFDGMLRSYNFNIIFIVWLCICFNKSFISLPVTKSD